jgi:hypothetical protein
LIHTLGLRFPYVIGVPFTWFEDGKLEGINQSIHGFGAEKVGNIHLILTPSPGMTFTNLGLTMN